MLDAPVKIPLREPLALTCGTFAVAAELVMVIVVM